MTAVLKRWRRWARNYLAQWDWKGFGLCFWPHFATMGLFAVTAAVAWVAL